MYFSLDLKKYLYLFSLAINLVEVGNTLRRLKSVLKNLPHKLVFFFKVLIPGLYENKPNFQLPKTFTRSLALDLGKLGKIIYFCENKYFYHSLILKGEESVELSEHFLDTYSWSGTVFWVLLQVHSLRVLTATM